MDLSPDATLPPPEGATLFRPPAAMADRQRSHGQLDDFFIQARFLRESRAYLSCEREGVTAAEAPAC